MLMVKELWERFKVWWVAPRHPYENNHDRLIELHEQNKVREKEWLEACAKHERQELRDRFAMAALTGVLAHPTRFNNFYDDVAKSAWDYADAMLKARKEDEQ